MTNWQLGDIEVTSVLEQMAEFMTLEEFFDGFTTEMFDAHKDWLIPNAVSPTSGKMILPIQSYLVRTKHHTILIDTCVGCHKKFKWVPDWNNRRDDTYLKNLKAAGVDPAEIDYVFCTHLHVDHCGWNTKLEDQITSSSARACCRSWKPNRRSWWQWILPSMTISL
jgi:glyoxylase-like metal-dependent hydrolase (beta-lactamase superfamily II)